MKHSQSNNHLYKDRHRASGGFSIQVRKDTPQSHIHVDTDLQAIVIKARLHKLIHICSIYIPPHDPISDIKINELLQQIPKSYLLLGDLNSHSLFYRFFTLPYIAMTKRKLYKLITCAYLVNHTPLYTFPSRLGL